MIWVVIISIVTVLLIILAIVHLKTRGSGITFIERANLSNLPGCGRRLIRNIREKLGGC